MKRKLPICVGALLMGFWSAPLQAAANNIPLPVPAPQAKIQAASRAQNPAPPQAFGQASAAPVSGGLSSLFTRAKPAPGSHLTAEQRAMTDRVSASLSGIRTMVGDFVQVGPDGGKTEGQLYLQKPGRVRFEYAPPSPIELIADGQSLVVRDRKLATQDLYPLGQTPLRFLLADQVDLLRDTNVVEAYSDNTYATVVIEEKKTLGGTHKLMLMFGAQDMQLKQWTVTDPQGYDTTVAIYNVDTSRRPDPGLFKINYERVLQ